MRGKKQVFIVVVTVVTLMTGYFIGSLQLDNTLKATSITTSLPESGQSSISVQGEGIIKVAPDVAYVTLGVETSSKEMTKAQKDNKDKMNEVMNELYKLGIKKEDIQTQSYQVYPDYQWEDNKSVLKGYKVSNLVRVKIVKIDDTGKVLDAIADKGANHVTGIQFTLADEKQYYNEALQLALKNAEDKAKAMAGYFGITDIKPVSITEGSQGIYYPPTPYYRAAEDGGKSTPISPGQLEVRAHVSVNFSY
jgi:uncharacterized protein